ncbi:hypothetical protein ACSNOB_05785 [Micromonospora sp. URMC 106]|uniref:hypothetical protein n=1 Tax=Micromonospora sp. URMC 106 TaxID=3423408 RepID=UPI003F1A41C7
MTPSQKDGGAAQQARWLLGVLLLVQGFGSALTEALRGTSFGVAGLLRAAGLPEWTDYLVGAAGAVLLVWAALRWRVAR